MLVRNWVIWSRVTRALVKISQDCPGKAVTDTSERSKKLTRFGVEVGQTLNTEKIEDVLRFPD